MTESAAMRVVIADDSVLLREGMARLLEDAGFEIVGQAGDADELMLKVRSWKPNVAIVDIRMPPTQTDEGLRAAKEIRESHPEVGVLVLSQYVEASYAMELLQESAEGLGYLLKDRIADVAEFAGAVRRVGEGGSALDPSIVSLLVGRRRGSGPLDQLTPREREVLELMAEGFSNAAVATRMFVEPGGGRGQALERVGGRRGDHASTVGRGPPGVEAAGPAGRARACTTTSVFVDRVSRRRPAPPEDRGGSSGQPRWLMPRQCTPARHQPSTDRADARSGSRRARPRRQRTSTRGSAASPSGRSRRRRARRARSRSG